MKKKLKPCPFCGKAAFSHPLGRVVSCMNLDCRIEGQWFDPEKWNRRATLWQPIETAPKDGSLVLLWIADGGDKRTGAMEKGRVFDFGPMAIGYQGNWKITHWQPLPEPPKEP